jgi:uncharacterized protein YraI
MKSPVPLALLAVSLSVLPVAAPAQAPSATTAQRVNVRAGPARDYPVVTILPAAYVVSVQGCLPEYTWCDVIAGSSRGWVYAGNLGYFHEGRHVPLRESGPVAGVAVVDFILEDYWRQHYQGRPWYGERDRWGDRDYRLDTAGQRPDPGAAGGRSCRRGRH